MVRLTDKFESLMTAVAFAEAGEHDTAMEFLGMKKPESKKFEIIEVPGVKIWYRSEDPVAVSVDSVKIRIGTITG